MLNRAIVWACILSAVSASLFALPSAGGNNFGEHACSYDKLPAFCGTLRVPEDRTSAVGRTIVLHFVRVPAQHRGSAAPIVWFDGGPGESVITDFSDGGIQGYPFTAVLHETHEILFLDQRGTGRSHQLQCPMYPHVSDVFAYIFPRHRVGCERPRRKRQRYLDAW